MKKYFKLILFSITYLFFAYLIGSFYSATFDLRIWTEDTRFVISMIGLILVLVSNLYYALSSCD